MKNINLLLLLILLTNIFSYSQNDNNSKTDSLIKLINKSKKDTSKVNLYIKLGVEYMNSDVIESEKNLLRAKELSIELAYKQGLAETFNKLGVLFYRQGKSEIALEHFNKALEKVPY